MVVGRRRPAQEFERTSLRTLDRTWFVLGRGQEFPNDTALHVMVNESMVERLGWEKPIGKRFQFDEDSTVFHRVVGVIKDFHPCAQLSIPFSKP